MKKYYNIRIAIKEEQYDLAYGVLYEYPTIGIEEKFDELIITFEFNSWNPEIKRLLINELTSIDKDTRIISEDIIVERNWLEEFEKQTKAIKINDRIGIVPEWKQEELNTEIKIIINPKMSFGTGEHSTTKLMCEMLEKYVKKDSFWIDAGCGTGILAILAKILGAKEVFAFDNDDWSVNNTIENIELNKIDNIEVKQASIENIPFPDSDGIAANLFSNLLMSAMPKFYTSLNKSDGVLIVSGILIYDKKEIIDSAIRNSFYLVEEQFDEEWVSMCFKIRR